MLDPSTTIRLALAIFRTARRRIQVVGSTAWPMADGTVFSGVVEHDDLHGWAAVITYSYVAMGEYYSGVCRRGFRRKKRAEAFLERLPSKTRLPVRYKANQPEISTILWSDLNLLLAGF